jgi:hypothetical protein
MKLKFLCSLAALAFLFSACNSDEGVFDLGNGSSDFGVVISKAGYDNAGAEYKGSAKVTIAPGITLEKVKGNDHELVFASDVEAGTIVLYVKNGNIFKSYTFATDLWLGSKYIFNGKDVSGIKYGAFEAAVAVVENVYKLYPYSIVGVENDWFTYIGGFNVTLGSTIVWDDIYNAYVNNPYGGELSSKVTRDNVIGWRYAFGGDLFEGAEPIITLEHDLFVLYGDEYQLSIFPILKPETPDGGTGGGSEDGDDQGEDNGNGNGQGGKGGGNGQGGNGGGNQQ